MRSTNVFLVPLVVLAAAAGAQTLQPMNAGVVPVVAHLPGKLGSFWTTNMYIRQTEGTTPALVTITIHNPAGPDWGGTVQLSTVSGTLETKDVVKEVVAGIPDGKYVLSWSSTQPVVLTTRTYTTEACGTYGQGVGSVAPSTGLMANGEAVFPVPMDHGSQRVAVGIANSGSVAQTFDVSALDGDGNVVHSWTRTVAGGALDQFETNDGMSGTGSISVKCTAGCNGTAYAYSSVAVNDSNDAYFLYAGTTTCNVADIEGHGYCTVLIGNQLWMAENLRTTSYNNGDPIPRVTGNAEWTALVTPAFCWYDNDEAAYGAEYGALYNWFAVDDASNGHRNICPAGWHIPTEAEWTELTDSLGGLAIAGGKMKEAGTAHWTAPNTGATNASGFAALPGGYRGYVSGAFGNVGTFGHWWSSTASDSSLAWGEGLFYLDNPANHSTSAKKNGFSVRCVRN